MSFFLLLNTKEDILKNVENQTVAIDFHSMEKNTVEVFGNQKLFNYQHSSKYIRLCSTEERNSTWKTLFIYFMNSTNVNK